MRLLRRSSHGLTTANDDFGTLPASQECPTHYHPQYPRDRDNCQVSAAVGHQLGAGRHKWTLRPIIPSTSPAGGSVAPATPYGWDLASGPLQYVIRLTSSQLRGFDARWTLGLIPAADLHSIYLSRVQYEAPGSDPSRASPALIIWPTCQCSYPLSLPFLSSLPCCQSVSHLLPPLSSSRL